MKKELLSKIGMNYFKADLHIHTCLSPCADLSMSPKAIIKRALQKKLHIIAICDHNSSENTVASIKASKGKIKVLAGMEITSMEEVHILALFEGIREVQKLQDIVYKNLPKEKNDPLLFGDQVVVNEFDEVEGFNEYLLFGATRLGIQELVRMIHDFKGLAIAAHIDRQTFGIIGQLGFIPDELGLDALEITCHYRYSQIRERYPQTLKYPLITASDAHELKDIGKAYTTMYLNEPTIDEIKLALLKKDQRTILEENH